MFYDTFISQIFGIFPRKFSGNIPLFFRKFPENFRRKFPEISQLTTLPTYFNSERHHVTSAGAGVLLAFITHSRCRLRALILCRDLYWEWEATPPSTTYSKHHVNYFTQTG